MCINWSGVWYRVRRCFGATDFDREQKRRREKTDLTLDETLIQSLNIAPLSDLPVPISARVSYLVYFILFCALFFFLFQGFSTARNEKFLALSSSAGVCKSVPKSVSGVYKFDVHGNWEGSESFSISQSIYVLTLNRIQYTDEEFAQLVRSGLAQINNFAADAHQRSLVENLVFWMTWSINTVASANRQHIRMVGDAKTLYNQGSTHLAGMATRAGKCNVAPEVSYEKAGRDIVCSHCVQVITRKYLSDII